MRILRANLAIWLVIFVSAGAIVLAGDYLKQATIPYKITFAAEDSEQFRQQMISDDNIQKIQELSRQYSIPFIRILASSMITHDFCLDGNQLDDWNEKAFRQLEEYLQENCQKEYEQLLITYGKIWSDVAYFPVAESIVNKDATVSFENSWMYERNFGGKRGHEGTDLMATVNKRGYYPVVSMTDGVVEKIGWLTKGGYRIGVRSPMGGYYYYAHLYGYAEPFQVGDTICAGQLIGYMGDSGYGSEGTTGQFPVHLHMGIYFEGQDGEEISVNPYPVLKYVQKKTLKYSY